MNFRKTLNYLILIFFNPGTNKSLTIFLPHKSFCLLLYQAVQRRKDHQAVQIGEFHQAAQGVQSTWKQFLAFTWVCWELDHSKETIQFFESTYIVIPWELFNSLPYLPHNRLFGQTRPDIFGLKILYKMF